MKITIRVKPNARMNAVKPADDGTYQVSVTAPPIDSKANLMVIDVLAGYFGKPKRNISILRGHKGKIKLIEIT